MPKQKLELMWVGKEKRAKLEPRILIEDPEKSYHADKRVSDNDIFDNMLIHGDNLLALPPEVVGERSFRRGEAEGLAIGGGVERDQVAFVLLQHRAGRLRYVAGNDYPIVRRALRGGPLLPVVGPQVEIIAVHLVRVVAQLEIGVDAVGVHVEREREEIPFSLLGEGLYHGGGLVYRQASRGA